MNPKKKLPYLDISISRRVRKVGRMWIRIFPDKSITKKPAETRMGKGKGAPEYWVAVVKPGRVLFEIDGLDQKAAEEAFRVCSYKLPIKTISVFEKLSTSFSIKLKICGQAAVNKVNKKQ